MSNALTLTDEEVQRIAESDDPVSLAPFLAVYRYDKSRNSWCSCSCCRIGKYLESKRANL